MLKIDKAAAAFRAADVRYTVERTDKLGKFNVVENHGDDKITMHGEHMRHDQALVLRDALGGRDGTTAALQEMISIPVLTVALTNCGAPRNACLPLARQLLPAIIDLLESDAEGKGGNIINVKEG